MPGGRCGGGGGGEPGAQVEVSTLALSYGLSPSKTRPQVPHSEKPPSTHHALEPRRWSCLFISWMRLSHICRPHLRSTSIELETQCGKANRLPADPQPTSVWAPALPGPGPGPHSTESLTGTQSWSPFYPHEALPQTALPAQIGGDNKEKLAFSNGPRSIPIIITCSKG